MGNAGFPSFILFYCNLLRNQFYIKTLCIVAVGRSDCEHFRHIQVSPTHKLQATDFFTNIRYYVFKVSLVFYLTTRLTNVIKLSSSR